MQIASRAKAGRAAFVRLLTWIITIIVMSSGILAVAIAAASYLASRFGGDQSGWAQAIGAVLAIVTGFATTLYQLRSQKADVLALEAASGRAAYLLAHDALEAVTDRLEAALTPRSDSKIYALRGGRTSELVGAMREFETSRLPSAVLSDFIRLRSRVAAINQRLTEVYGSEDRLRGKARENKRAERHERLASVVAVSVEAREIFANLENTAISLYEADALPINDTPLVHSYNRPVFSNT